MCVLTSVEFTPPQIEGAYVQKVCDCSSISCNSAFDTTYRAEQVGMSSFGLKVRQVLRGYPISNDITPVIL